MAKLTEKQRQALVYAADYIEEAMDRISSSFGATKWPTLEEVLGHLEDSLEKVRQVANGVTA